MRKNFIRFLVTGIMTFTCSLAHGEPINILLVASTGKNVSYENTIVPLFNKIREEIYDFHAIINDSFEVTKNSALTKIEKVPDGPAWENKKKDVTKPIIPLKSISDLTDADIKNKDIAILVFIPSTGRLFQDPGAFNDNPNHQLLTKVTQRLALCFMQGDSKDTKKRKAPAIEKIGITEDNFFNIFYNTLGLELPKQKTLYEPDSPQGATQESMNKIIPMLKDIIEKKTKSPTYTEEEEKRKNEEAKRLAEETRKAEEEAKHKADLLAQSGETKTQNLKLKLNNLKNSLTQLKNKLNTLKTKLTGLNKSLSKTTKT